MDIVTYALCNKKAKQYTDAAINNLPKGIVFKGSVNYYSDLPNNAEIGDCYTVLYSGTSGSDPSGIEYVWGLNTETSTEEWIAIGPDLSDYVKNTDYATSSVAGVVKPGWYNFEVSSGGRPYLNSRTYAQYQTDENGCFISKGTLENVITEKGLVKNTDYATTSTAGIVKVSPNDYGINTTSNGILYSKNANYSDYTNASSNFTISKGTLENVITGKGLVSNTDYATNVTGGVVKISSYYGTGIYNDGKIYATTYTSSQYDSADDHSFISKGTLDNVLTATIGDISSVLDTINGEVV